MCTDFPGDQWGQKTIFHVYPNNIITFPGQGTGLSPTSSVSVIYSVTWHVSCGAACGPCTEINCQYVVQVNTPGAFVLMMLITGLTASHTSCKLNRARLSCPWCRELLKTLDAVSDMHRWKKKVRKCLRQLLIRQEWEWKEGKVAVPCLLTQSNLIMRKIHSLMQFPGQWGLL